jgi:hypothetical protein
MNVIAPHVPASVTGDSNDVATALDVANALWDKGENAEAIRWLHRAVDAAGEAGDGERAADLARAASELTAAIEGRPSAGASVPPPAESGPPSTPSPSAPPAHEPWPDSSERVLAPPAVSPAGPSAPSPDAPTAGGAYSPLEGWMRVSVKTSVRDPKLFILRPLADGEAAPRGTQEGFLVLADSRAIAPKKPNGGGAA